MPLLVLLTFASGFAGLGYEMVWTRLLSVALGTEMMAVLGSIAGFFTGLAVGAFLLDRWLQRTRSPRHAYALLELTIGGWGLASIWALPAAGRALPPLLGTDPDPLSLALCSFALPALVLLPATIAMGGTLTALERWMALQRQDIRLSAGVYAANTAGAVAGTLACAFLLFPLLGLSGTLIGLAIVNIACATAALLLQMPTRVATPAGRQSPPNSVRNDPATPHPALDASAGDVSAPASRRTPAVALLVTGLLGISVEVLVVRLAAQTLQNTLYTFAGLLAAYLTGTALGSGLWQRFGSHVPTRLARPRLLGLTALACLLTAALVPQGKAIAAALAAAGVAGELGLALTLFLLPSMAMGALFGHLLQEVRDQRGSIGWAIGVNSIGAAVAPLLAAECLIPALGAWRALVLAALAYLVLMRRRDASVMAWTVLPVLLGGALLWMPAPVLIRVPEGGAVLALREGAMATASAVSDQSGARYLEINGHFRMGGTSSMRSDYRQAFLPLLLHPSPHRALFLGIGTGATVVGGTQLPDVSVQAVELSHEVVDLLPWFAESSGAALAPITVADARRFVAADNRQYDVIVADLFHPALEGSGALYTLEHFTAIRHRLAPGGLFCQWLPLYQLDQPSLQAIIRTFLATYPDGSAWLNHYSVRTPMLALIGHAVDPVQSPASILRERLAQADVAVVTRPVGIGQPLDVLGQFVGGPQALAAFAAGAPLNTDDRPFVALDARRNVQALSAPPAALLLRVIMPCIPRVARHSARPRPRPPQQ